jgi:hypothetical protein
MIKLEEVNKNIPFEIIDNGEGYLKLAKNKDNGSIIYLKEYEVLENEKKVKMVPVDETKVLISMWEFLNKHRVSKQIQEETDKKTGYKVENSGRNIILYELQEVEGEGLKFKACNDKDGYIYPMMWIGAPPEETLQMATAYKRIIPILSEYMRKIRKNPFILLALKDFFTPLIDFIHFGLRATYLLDREGYSKSPRVLYDFISSLKINEDTRDKIRDILCFIIQFDYAYKGRLFDGAENLDKTQFVKERVKLVNKLIIALSFFFPFIKRKFWRKELFSKPTAEVFRLFSIVISRDYYPMTEKWQKIRDYLCTYLEFSNFRNVLIDAINSFDMTRFKMTEEEEYWYSYMGDYQYKGMSPAQRKEWREKKHGR